MQAQALVVPQRAVSRDEKGDPTVPVIGADAKLAQRVIVALRTIGENWLVASGLQPGERVVVQGATMLRAGMPVTTVPWSPNVKGVGNAKLLGARDTLLEMTAGALHLLSDALLVAGAGAADVLQWPALDGDARDAGARRLVGLGDEGGRGDDEEAAVRRRDRMSRTVLRGAAVGRAGTAALPLSLLISFLCLATRYESWPVPLYLARVDLFLVSLDAQRTAYSAQQQLPAARLMRARALVELYYALGRGTSRS